MTGTAKKNNRQTLIAAEVAARARAPVHDARNKMVPCQVDGGSSAESTTLLSHGTILHAQKGEKFLNASAHDSGQEGLTYMPVPSSKPARLLIRGTIEMYQ
jgi:hypothetical protein